MQTTETSMNLAPEPLTVSHGIVKIVRKSLKEEHAHTLPLHFSRAPCNFLQSDFTLLPPTMLYTDNFEPSL